MSALKQINKLLNGTVILTVKRLLYPHIIAVKIPFHIQDVLKLKNIGSLRCEVLARELLSVYIRKKNISFNLPLLQWVSKKRPRPQFLTVWLNISHQYVELPTIVSITHSLFNSILYTKTLVTAAFVLSPVGYYNCLLYDRSVYNTNRLQVLQNGAVCKFCKVTTTTTTTNY